MEPRVVRSIPDRTLTPNLLLHLMQTNSTQRSGPSPQGAENVRSLGLLSRIQGQGGTLPPRASAKQIVMAGGGGSLAVGVVAAVGTASATPLILGSFGASCVMLFGFPDTPFAQPRNVIAGHTLSSLIGLAALKIFGPHGWAMALALGTAIACMLATRTVHPPAGSNPVIVFLTQPDWSFLVTPTLLGSILLVMVAWGYWQTTGGYAYPKYWLGRNPKPQAPNL